MGIHEECGVFAISNNNDMSVDVVTETYFALYALQHRGQESCGIAINSDGVIKAHKSLGLVPDLFKKETLTSLERGQMAIGHVRYAPHGEATISSAQPIVVKHAKGSLSIAYNGALTNAFELRTEMQNSGIIFHNNSDVEVIAYAVAKERLTSPSIDKAIIAAMEKLKGAYSMVLMSPQKLFAMRDEEGFRPLCIGKLKNSYVFASESCAIDSIGATFVRDVEPGEIVKVVDGELISVRKSSKKGKGLCIFEFVYFARPDSVIEGASVHEARKRAGAFLAKQHKVEADVVIGVPDSGLDAAMGFAVQSGIPYGVGLLKNRYIGRTFIQPTQGERINAVKIKLNAISATVKGKRVVLIDDSIVRGTTSAYIVNILRDAGAKEVHMRISSPPFINPCYFGTDIDSKDKLIACRLTKEEIAKQIGVDSLGYLSIENVKNIASEASCDFCVGCFTGDYPVEPPLEIKKDKFDIALKG